MSGSFVSRDTVKRLARDVASISKSPLPGIYYAHSDTDMLSAYALMIGREGTPYAGGFYFFKVTYPADYPNNPPSYKFLTNNGYTRMNPNLYVDGKTCLSVLNTWHGDQWSGCQTISSTLLSVSGVLNESPLCNEPGYTDTHPAFWPYYHSIAFMNFKLAMVDVLRDQHIAKECPALLSIAKRHYVEHFDVSMEELGKARAKYAEFADRKEDTVSRIEAGVYRMATTVDYPSVVREMRDLKKEVEAELIAGKSK